eukprot:TRINITY_DN26469_c0_g1_i2.p2 TRINITY_DN26469_c0_g1~~TRINITY_DN26469_c0_g1_i2.p2  ORF type:complete len:218 (-),score=-9.58 TRINITY_DN26469_c0_g1_i2:220-873(-)
MQQKNQFKTAFVQKQKNFKYFHITVYSRYKDMSIYGYKDTPVTTTFFRGTKCVDITRVYCIQNNNQPKKSEYTISLLYDMVQCACSKCTQSSLQKNVNKNQIKDITQTYNHRAKILCMNICVNIMKIYKDITSKKAVIFQTHHLQTFWKHKSKQTKHSIQNPKRNPHKKKAYIITIQQMVIMFMTRRKNLNSKKTNIFYYTFFQKTNSSNYMIIIWC